MLLNNNIKGVVKVLLLSLTMISLFVTLSGCISWNVYTSLETKLNDDGSIERNGNITLKRFNTEDGERFVVEMDTSAAKSFIKDNFVPPEGKDFEGYTENLDSTYSVYWSMRAEPSQLPLSDYKRLTSDSLSYSGNEISAEVHDLFFRTDYEYREIIFDAVSGDSVMKMLPEILPLAIDAYENYLKRFTPSRSALNAIKNSKDSTVIILTNYWNEILKHLFYKPSDLNNGDNYFDELKDSTISSLQNVLASHAGGSEIPIEIIEKAVTEGENKIDEEFRLRNINLWGAYNAIGDNRSYFKVSLIISGRIKATNADSVDDNYLEWRFNQDDIRGKEALLYASSSYYKWYMLIISVIGALVLVLIIAIIAKKIVNSRSS